jgi:hypothetical protein
VLNALSLRNGRSCYIRGMKKILAAALLLMVFAARHSPPAITIIAITIITTHTPKTNPGPKQHHRGAGPHFFFNCRHGQGRKLIKFEP